MERKNIAINIDIEKIKDEYEKIFNDSNRTKEAEEADNVRVNDFLREHANTTYQVVLVRFGYDRENCSDTH
jgi:hypothetical protein